jgi:hypothetical protein
VFHTQLKSLYTIEKLSAPRRRDRSRPTMPIEADDPYDLHPPIFAWPQDHQHTILECHVVFPHQQSTGLNRFVFVGHGIFLFTQVKRIEQRRRPAAAGASAASGRINQWK